MIELKKLPYIIGKNHNVAKMQLMDPSGYVTDAVYFGEAEDFKNFADNHEYISITYYPEINSYQGREALQAVIRNYC